MKATEITYTARDFKNALRTRVRSCWRCQFKRSEKCKTCIPTAMYKQFELLIDSYFQDEEKVSSELESGSSEGSSYTFD